MESDCVSCVILLKRTLWIILIGSDRHRLIVLDSIRRYASPVTSSETSVRSIYFIVTEFNIINVTLQRVRYSSSLNQALILLLGLDEKFVSKYGHRIE